MADEGTFPRWLYPAGGPTEPDYGGRCFNSQEELDAARADGPWYQTPTEAADAAAKATAVQDAGEAEGEHPTRRSHR